jgi:hypothetical protein
MNERTAELLPGPLRDLRTAALKSCLVRYGEEWVGLFQGLISSFARWVWDLPASERSHHVFPFGLLAHSLDVMARTARVSPTIYGPCVGLLHDCGRLFDLDIARKDGGERWDPLLEPLHAFSLRGGYRVAWRAGRGLVRHEKSGLSLLRVLLPSPHRSELAGKLEFAYTAYCRRHDPSPPMYSDELWDLVGEVHQADCQSAAAGRPRPADHAPERPARANAWGRLENKRGVSRDPSGLRTGTFQNAQNPGNPSGAFIGGQDARP